jgi:hypothetical protein
MSIFYTYKRYRKSETPYALVPLKKHVNALILPIQVQPDTPENVQHSNI